jgi:hypothetical protein
MRIYFLNFIPPTIEELVILKCQSEILYTRTWAYCFKNWISRHTRRDNIVTGYEHLLGNG